jgi:hypothetical protein
MVIMKIVINTIEETIEILYNSKEEKVLDDLERLFSAYNDYSICKFVDESKLNKNTLDFSKLDLTNFPVDSSKIR